MPIYSSWLTHLNTKRKPKNNRYLPLLRGFNKNYTSATSSLLYTLFRGLTGIIKAVCIITDGGKVVYYGQENKHSAVG